MGHPKQWHHVMSWHRFWVFPEEAQAAIGLLAAAPLWSSTWRSIPHQGVLRENAPYTLYAILYNRYATEEDTSVARVKAQNPCDWAKDAHLLEIPDGCGSKWMKLFVCSQYFYTAFPFKGPKTAHKKTDSKGTKNMEAQWKTNCTVS